MRHRGKHSSDDKIFTPKWQAVLKEAAQDLSFLLGRGYADKSSLMLVGNRYQLNTRQQKALMRISCPSDRIGLRKGKELKPEAIKDQKIIIDGYNLLITIEVALSGGLLFDTMDNCYRDIASLHGTYKKVEETIPALELVGEALQKLEVKEVLWYFDAPVSNSGRLKVLLYELAGKYGYSWQIELVNNPDKTIIEHNQISVSCDGWIIDETDQWFNLARYVIEDSIPQAEILKF
ncbi:MAG: DUF434 domain-containing protein [Aureispira sp.]|nr:DUF434 domain-containing protein [Aureispira sp.]